MVFIFSIMPFTSSAQLVAEVSGTSANLFGVYALNSTTAWTCGVGGVILKTTTPGTWVAQTSNASQTLVSISFPSATNGCVVGTSTNNKVRTTIDGGTTWANISDPAAASASLHDVYFVTTSDGWASGANGDILKSNDGGNTWTAQLTTITGQRMRSIFFLDTQTGWATGDGGHIIGTTVGGENIGGGGDSGDNDAWDLKANLSVTTLFGVVFINATTGWVVGTDGAIRKTIDGGDTWSIQNSGTTETLRAVGFANSNTGWIVGTGGTILKTTDGGTTWGTQVSGTIQDLFDLSIIDLNTLIAVGAGGTISKTTNGGGAIDLPVELTSFTAKELNKGIIDLNWTTATETNNKGFSIEWSLGANTWQEIGFVIGKGTTAEIQKYAYSHPSPTAGMNYYRLKQVDFDGKIAHSSIQSVNHHVAKGKFTVYPNPVQNDQLMVSLLEPSNRFYNYTIYNSIGLPIIKGQLDISSRQQIAIDVHLLHSGVYYLELFKGTTLMDRVSFMK